MTRQYQHTNTLTRALLNLRNTSGKGITFIKSNADEDVLSYDQLITEAVQALGGLQQRGIYAGHELILQVEDNRTFLVLFWACILGKIIPVPLSTGNQDDHKLKLLKVYQTLSHPCLVSDEAHLDRLEKYAAEHDQLSLFNIIRQHAFTPGELDNSISGTVAEATADDIAYIQFSSGSTGEPKGVVLTHANLVANTTDIAARSGVGANDRMLSWMPLTHDMGLICFHLTGIHAAAAQYLMPTALFVRRPVLWIEKASEHKVTLLYSPNFGYSYFLASFTGAVNDTAGWDLSSIRIIYNGAEPISHELCERFIYTLGRFGMRGNVMYPGYGLAEASVAVCLPDPGDLMRSYIADRKSLKTGKKIKLVEKGENGVSFMEVGYPIPQCRVRIAGDNDEELQPGYLGHIQIAGANVTAGYYNNAAATAKVITKDGWLRTGDLGFFINERLVITGRAKNIIILYGQNYYPQDIERAVEQVNGLGPGKVVACGVKNPDSWKEELVLFVLFKDKLTEFVKLLPAIRNAVADQTGLTVDSIIPISRIPKTTSGKVQHFKLNEAYQAGQYTALLDEIIQLQSSVGLSLTQAAAEAWLQQTCNRILGVQEINVADNLFEWGISSLQATRLASYIKDWTGKDFSVWEVLSNPVIRDIAALMAGNQQDEETTTAVVPLPQQEHYPVSEGQTRFWTLHQYEEARAACNISVGFRLKGNISITAYDKALCALAERHESLRTTFTTNGIEPVQLIHHNAEGAYTFDFTDLRHEAGAEITASRITREDADKPFDLVKGPLWRSRMIAVRSNEFIITLTFHHIISDGWSVLLALNEINTLYTAFAKGEQPALQPLHLQAKDHVYARLQHTSDALISRNQEYWANEFSGDIPVLDLPVKSPRPPFQTFSGHIRRFSLSAGETKRLGQLSRKHEATMFMTLLSLVNVLLYKYTGQTDIIIGTDTSGRDNKDLEKQIGYFLRTLPVRTSFDRDTRFTDLLNKVKGRLLNAYKHQDFSFGRLLQDTGNRKDISRSPLFDVLVIYQNFGQSSGLDQLGNTEAVSYDIDTHSALLDLHIEFSEQNGSLAYSIRYSDLYTAEQVERMGNHFAQLARHISQHPELSIAGYEMLTAEEKKTLIHDFNNTETQHKHYNNLASLFEEQVSKTPDNIAVRFGGEQFSYTSINNKANQFAHFLQKEYHVQPGTRIGLLVTPSEKMIIQLMAVYKTGAILVPLSTEYPAERIRQIIHNSGIQLICADKLTCAAIEHLPVEIIPVELFWDLAHQYPENNPACTTSCEDTAYIMYTSGSTGTPKGVIIRHESVIDYVQTFSRYFNLVENDIVIQQSELTFDTAVEEIFPALSAGAGIVVMSNRGRNVDDIIEAIEVNKATILSTTPLVLQEINRHADTLTSLRAVISGGDKLRASFIDKLIEHTNVYNTYGPTESTVCTTFNRLTKPSDVSVIGRPIANRKVFILDEDLKPVAAGVKGEIYIAGKGLASGYQQNDTETALHFIESPFVPAMRLYKSGDMGRWLNGGKIEFLGRKDSQVKINGYRVEIPEVEQAMISLEAVTDIAVETCLDRRGSRQLVAFYTGTAANDKYFRSNLLELVPHYMVPSFFIHLDAMPVNANGKTDRKALPFERITGQPEEDAAHTMASTKTEEKLKAVWEEVLGETGISVTANFFELGGNSIDATRIAMRILKEFNVKILLKHLFIYPTIREQAGLIAGGELSTQQAIIPLEEKEFYEVSNGQKRLWLLDQFKEAKLAYNLSWAFRLQGELNFQLFEKSLQTIIERHEVLRTNIITADGTPKQKICPAAEFPFAVQYADLRHSDDKDIAAGRIIEKESNWPFDLATEPLVRASMIRMTEDERVFVFVIHHIIADGWSMQVLVNELAALYNGLVKGVNVELPTLPFQYKDFVNWQQLTLDGDAGSEHKDYWLSKFSGGPVPVLEMPTDHLRPLVQTYNGKRTEFSISADSRRKLTAVGAENDTTLFAVLLAGVYTLLYKYTRQEDIVIGTPVMGREREDFESQMGLYLNTLALRTRFRGDDSFRALLNRVRATVMQAYEHQAYPFDYLVDELSLEANTGRSALFDVMVGFQDTETAVKKLNTLHGLTAIPVEKPAVVSQFDISIDFFDREDGLGAAIEFNTDLFKPAYIERFIEQYITLLEAVTDNAGLPLYAIDYIPGKQKEQLLGFNGENPAASTDTSILQAFEAQAALYPDATAVVYNDIVVTYRQLNEKANQLAHYLRQVYAVQPNDVIGLYTGRSAEMIIYLLGILKSGAAYLPIDAEYLSDRVSYIVADSRMKILLSARPDDILTEDVTIADLKDIEEKSAGYPVHNPVPVNQSGDLAYIIYTSGSTGKPKGVMVNHANLLSVSGSWTKHYELGTFPVCTLQLASISFDVFTGDLCRTLLHGGKLVICPSDTRPDIEKLYALILQHRVTMLESTPALILPLMEYVWENKLDVSFIQLLIIGSDTCLIEDYKGLQTRFGSVMRIINSYGTTETTIDSSFYEEPVQNLTDTGTTPIGKPLANTQYFVLDDHQQILPISIPGELCIGGAGVSVGYLNDEELQNKKFIPDPFNPGARLYRTGDMVRWLDDGNMQFLGRGDFQVKIRGYRIELGEIEDALLRYEGVRDAVVLARTDGNGEQYLAAYYVLREDVTADQSSLRSWLQQRLPGYMVPSYLTELPSFPLTSNGKVDRKALPAPVLSGAKDNYVALRTATEQAMAAIWEEVLNRSGIGIEDNFFECGGHSLKAAKLITRIHKELGIKAELRNLFTHPTISSLCELLSSGSRKEYKNIPRVEDQPCYPLSHAQRRLWILEQVEEDRVAYNMPVCYELQGKPDREALAKSLYSIIERHEILRTRFVVVDGEPWQKVLGAEAAGFKLQQEDISDKVDQGQWIVQMLEEEKHRAFDLEKGPLLRSRLVHLSGDRYLLLFNMHHIISDGWSVDVLVRELTALYNGYVRGTATELPSLPVQYRDYSAWQSGQLSSASMQEHGAYWKKQFKEGAPVLGLATDYARPATKTYKGGTVKRVLNKELSEGISRLSLEQGTSVFISLLSAVKALLYRYTGQREIVVGFPVSGRDHGELEGQIGFYVNTLALRTSVEGTESFSSLLSRVSETTLNAYEHQQYPFDVLVEELDLARDLSRSPLFDVLVVMQQTEAEGIGPAGMEGVEIKEREVDWGVSKFDLTFSFTEGKEGLQLQVEYNADLFMRERIERLMDHYTCIWQSVLKNKEEQVLRLEYITEAEKESLVHQFNGTSVSYPSSSTIQQIFEQRVMANPEAVAVISGESNITYRELNERSNQLAHYLRRNYSTGRDTLVGLMVERSEWMIVGIMGILKAGAAYVPIDPEYPADRKAYLLQDSAVSLLITDDEQTDAGNYGGEKIFLRSQWDTISKDMPLSNGVIDNQPHDLAYVIYTSGSSGLPKGVLIEHQNVVRLLFNEQFQFDFSDRDVWTVFHSMCFDFSVWEIFGSILYGGKLVIVPRETAQSPRLFARLLEQEKVTVLNQVPGVFNNVVQEVLSGAEDYNLQLRYVIFGGEALNPASLSGWYERYPEVKLVNMYGITETTVHTTYKEIGKEEIGSGDSNIGKAIPTVELYLADSNINLVADGIVGEILVGGLGVARGYLNRPELTSERFINNPWKSGERLYRSGDLGRRMASGELVYMGRGDFQVKIRGYRIELGEIEDALLRYEGVRDAVVLARTDGNGEQYLAAYYVLREDVTADQSSLRSWLQQRLPGYMVPSYLTELSSFPLTSNGKVDRKALPAPVLSGAKDNYVAPRTATEQTMAAIWEEVLNRSRIGIEDNFFECGGHSLKAAKVITRIHKELGIKAELRNLFTHPTISSLCELLSSGSRKEYKNIPRVEDQPCYPLSHAQRRLWILEQVEEDRVAYNMPVCYELQGKPDREALAKSLYSIIERHEILRTRFVITEGEPWQKVMSAEESGFKLEQDDIRGEQDPDLWIAGMLEEEKQRPFDLEQGPLLRCRLVQADEEKYLLLFNMHHIISDGWSVDVLVRELTALYNGYVRGTATELPSLPVQYRDYSAWQTARLSSAAMQEHGNYWKEQFKEGSPVLGIPSDHARPATKTYRGSTVKCVLNKELGEGIKSLGLEEGTSLFISLLSGVKALLYRYTGQQDIVIGFPVSGREHGELEGQIGFYVNTLALRTTVEGTESFSSLLSRVSETTLNAYEHQQYPFDVLVEELELERDMSRSPLFDVMVVMQHTEAEGRGIGVMEGVEIKEKEVEWGVSKFDLTFSFAEREEGIQLQVEYNADLYERERIERLVGHYAELWTSVLKNKEEQVSRLEYITAAEKDRLLNDFNDTAAVYPSEATIQALFEQRVKVSAGAAAVISGENTLTYQELNERANQLAHYLRRNYNTGRNTLVGLMVERSEWMIIGIMGILKAGAAYVPIDPEYPESRRRYIAEDSDIRLLLTEKNYIDTNWQIEQADIRNNEIGQYPVTDPVNENSASDLAYVIYTSGTTGNPKGAQVEHRSVINLNAWLNDIIYSRQQEPLRVTLTASISFDSSVKQLFPSLLNGSAMVIISPEEKKDPALYIETIQRHAINLADITPSYLKIVLQQLIDTNGQLPSLQYTLSGGEPLSNQLAEEYQQLFGDKSKLVNVYGVTEATVDSTFEVISDPAERKSQQSIGKPIHNTQLFILDAAHNLLPVGIPGTLYIGGDGLSRGYINKRDLTLEKFIHNPVTGSGTIYNTGDMARWMADGTVEFLGRNDRQVKIRGFRIELDEIEQTLLRHESVMNAAVIARKDSQGAAYIVAYYLESTTVDRAALRDYLSLQLPAYMVPASFVKVERFVRTANGKLDYNALPDTEGDSISEQAFTTAANETEKQLVDIWEELLDRRPVSTSDNFFHIGGDSLKAMKLFASIYKQMGIRLSIKNIFTNPSIQQLARVIAESKRTNYLPIVPITVQEHYELSHSQKRLWILNQFEKDQTAYNIPVAFIFKGNFEYGIFVKALTALIERHEILRTSFVSVHGEPRQRVHDAADCRLAIEYINAGEFGIDVAGKETDTSFDLGTAPLMRVKLVQTAEQEHVCHITLHHIISDAWSNNILIKEVSVLYNAYKAGLANPLSPLPVQYKDYAVWQKECLSAGQFNSAEQYWMDQFTGDISFLEFPTGRLRPKIKSFEGDTAGFYLDPKLADALTALGNQHNATLFMVLVAIIKTLLYRYTAEKDIVVTTPIAGRDHPDLENQVGFYVNTLALRTKLDPQDKFTDLILKVREVVLGAYANQFYPFDMLTDKLGIPYDPSHAPLSEIMVVLQNGGQDGLQLDEVETGRIELDNTTSRFDLVIVFTMADGIIKADLTYNTAILDRALVAGMAADLNQLIESVVHFPQDSISRLPLITGDEIQELTPVTNDSEGEKGKDCIIRLLKEKVSCFPDSLAVSYDGREITYRELDQLSDQLAHCLANEYGVTERDTVGIRMKPSEYMFIAILAIVKAGAAFTQLLDAAGEQQQLKLVVDDEAGYTGIIRVPILDVTNKELYRNNPPVVTGRRSPGSTVLTTSWIDDAGALCSLAFNDASLISRANALKEQFNLNHSDKWVFLNAARVNDIIYEAWSILLNGGAILIPGHEEITDAKTQLQYITDNKVTIASLTPHQLYRIMDEEAGDTYVPDDLRCFMVSGSKLSFHRLRAWMDKYSPEKIKIINSYRTSVTGPVSGHPVAAADIESDQSLLGKTFPGSALLILDEDMNIVPKGIMGNIYISVPFNQEESFSPGQLVPHPFQASGWLLRTDDLALYTNDGNINYICRRKDAIYTVGKKIVPAGLEAILRKCPGVKDIYINSGMKAPGSYTVAITPCEKEAFTVKNILELQRKGTASGEQLHYLPGGLCVFHKNKSETDFTYQEIFEQHGYLKNGIAIKPGDVIFDVGANIGMFSLYASLHFPGTKVYAFEPLPPIFEMLQANAGLYKDTRIIPFNIGLSDNNQETTFTFYSHNTIISGQHSNLEEDKQTVRRYLINQFEQDGISLSEKRLEELVNESTQTEKYNCQLRRLSDIIKEQGIQQIDLLKIDVEKSEWEILQGISKKDWSKIKQIIIEVHDTNGRLETISRLLRKNGFDTVIEQDEVLKGTNLYNLYGRRITTSFTEEVKAPSQLLFNTGGNWTDPALFSQEVRKFCASQLPAFIMSAVEFVLVDELRLDREGQVDTKEINAIVNKTSNTSNGVEALVSATFTAEPMGDYLLWWSKKFDIDLQLRFSGYNQVFRDLLDAGKTPGIHILMVRFEDFARDKNNNTGDDDLIQHLEKCFNQLSGILTSRAGTCTYIAGIFPLSPNLGYSEKVIACLKDITSRWVRLLQSLNGVYVINFEELIRLYSITDVFDTGSDKIGHIPFTETFFAAIGTGLARKIRELKKPAFKVIALDCDNTLWKGICGEEGAAGVQVSGGYAELQRFMHTKYEEGFLLVLNSKNNEEDVWEVFEKNPGMILKKEQFVSWRINWNNKSDNLSQMAAELNLGVDSFCFIDDSAAECSEVMMNCPRALTLELPKDPADFALFLQHVWAFDKLEITAEDRQRNDMYISEKKRNELKNTQTSLDDYLSGLELQVSMQLADDEKLQRIAQLTGRTNQFNLKKKQYSQADIKSLTAEKGYCCWAITVRDKFGDYGLTGVVIAWADDGKLYIDSLLMSCRVLGRNAEQAVLYGLKKFAVDNNISEIVADYWPTAKNGLVSDFLENTGWTINETTEAYTQYRLETSTIPDSVPFITFYYNEALPDGDTENKTGGSITTSLADRAFIPDHIGIAVADIETAGKYYKEAGYNSSDIIYDPIQNVHLVMYTHDAMHAVELIAPHDERSPVNNILQKNGDIPYHICYRVKNLDHTLSLLDLICEYEVISKPQKAVLFNNKLVMFISIRNVGLVELLEDPGLTIDDSVTGMGNNMVVQIVTTHLDKASLFYTKLGYYEDRISGNSLSRSYSVLLKHKYYPSCIELIMPVKNESSPENEFLAKNGSHVYKLAFGKEKSTIVKKYNLPYMTEWNEISIIGNNHNWEWNQRLVNEQELLHKTIYESLKYSSARSLTRIPLYNLAKADSLENNYEAPKTETERRLCKIWEEILHLQKISMTDQFFKLGGNSIKATQVLSRIENQFGAEISLSLFFENDTLRDLALLVERSSSGQSAIRPVPESDHYDVSSAQKRLWLANKIEQDQVIYNISATYCIKGKFNAAAMQQAMKALIQRHESLRTTFTEIDGIPKQRISKAGKSGHQLVEIDLRNEPNGMSKALKMARESSLTAFDLVRGPLIRTALYRVEDEMYIFSQVVHHIVFDGWSVGVEMEDILKLYNYYNQDTGEFLQPPLPVQYRDYAAWENEQLQGEKLAKHRQYWMSQFDDEIPRLDFPVDYPRPELKTYNGAISSFLIEGELKHQVKQLINTHDISLFMLMMAGINGVLYRFTGQQDLVLGVPYSNRNHSDLESQIGFYVNMLPVRTKFTPSSAFSSILKQTRQTTLQAYDHGVYPFDRLVEDLRIPADLGRSPLFDVVIQMQNSNVQEVDESNQQSDFSISAVEMDRGVSKYDLLFNIVESNNGIHVDIEYNTDLFKPATIDSVRDNLLRLLHIVTVEPGITMSELRKQLMETAGVQLFNYDNQIIAEIEQDF